MNRKIFIAGGLVLLLIVDAVQKDAFKQCADFGDTCDVNLKHPCCDDSLKCAWSDSATEYQCLKRVLLGASCSDDEACMTIKFATCTSNGTCACSEKTFMIGPMLCSRLLGDTCDSNSECRVPNSECIDQKCQCKQKYFDASRAECENAYIGMPCRSSSYCHSNMENTQCVRYKCECSANYVLRNGSVCLSPLQCDSDSD
ncbi:hypothetical protein KQX54_015576, partial [Cotesia glomerata]